MQSRGLKKVQFKRQHAAARGGDAAERTEAGLRRVVLAALVICGPPLLLFAYYQIMFSGLVNADAMDFAQIGRNMSAGRGFSTYFLRPLALANGHAPLNQPETMHGPLYPFILSLFFSALGAKDAVAAAVSSLFYLLTIPVVYLLGKRVFNQTVGIAAALIVTVNSLMLDYAISGLNITLYVFLATSLLLVAFDLAKRSNEIGRDPNAKLPTAKLVLVGLLTALLYLTEPLFAWVIPLAVVGVATLAGGNRMRNLALALAPMCILVLPWMARNAVLTGNPVLGLRGNELWMHTPGLYPETSGYRMWSNEVAGGIPLLRAIIKKEIVGVGTVLQSLPLVTGSWVLAFFLPAFLVRFSEPAANTLRRLLTVGFVILLVIAPVFGVEAIGTMPLFAALIPAAIIFAVSYILYLIQQPNMQRASRATMTAVLGLVVIYPLMTVLLLGQPNYDLRGKAAARALAKSSELNDACLSDAPWVVAWYGNRRSVWVPTTGSTTSRVRSSVRDLRWLIATNGISGVSDEWKIVHQGLTDYNMRWYEAARNKQQEPKPFRFDAATLPIGRFPLIAALDGFTAVHPVRGQELDTVIAVLPPPSQPSGQSPGPQPGPRRVGSLPGQRVISSATEAQR